MFIIPIAQMVNLRLNVFADGLKLCSNNGRPVSFLLTVPFLYLSAFCNICSFAYCLSFAFISFFSRLFSLAISNLSPSGPQTLVLCFCLDLRSFKELLVPCFTLNSGIQSLICIIFCVTFSLL